MEAHGQGGRNDAATSLFPAEAPWPCVIRHWTRRALLRIQGTVPFGVRDRRYACLIQSLKSWVTAVRLRHDWRPLSIETEW